MQPSEIRKFPMACLMEVQMLDQALLREFNQCYNTGLYFIVLFNRLLDNIGNDQEYFLNMDWYWLITGRSCNF